MLIRHCDSARNGVENAMVHMSRGYVVRFKKSATLSQARFPRVKVESLSIKHRGARGCCNVYQVWRGDVWIMVQENTVAGTFEKDRGRLITR